MALGPSSLEEASRIWWELSQREMSVQDILDEAPLTTPLTPLQDRVFGMELDLDNPALPALSKAVRESRAFSVTPADMFADPELIFRPQESWNSAPVRRGDEYRREYLMARELFSARECAIAPLISKARVVGVVIADNLYSSTPIEEADLQLLDTLARQAGLAIDNARTYEALQKAQKDLLAADRLVVIGELAARISHEIRNPLATIGGWARNLLRKPDNPSEVQRKAGIIVDEVKRLEELLTDVLGIARARPLNLEPHRINEIVERALMLAEADIRASKVEIHKQLDDALPLTRVDRSRLLQALLNIIRNGAQSMSGKEDGVLRICTRFNQPSQLLLNEKPDAKSWIDIEVRDEGKGISEQALKQVFDPFFSTKLSGSGLGLSVTRRIVQDHGGEIEVESEPGQGTSFVLRLPYKPISDAQEQTQIGESQAV
jgi:signal transduction histidine kinase